MNLKEAYILMQENSGIEVGDTVKVLRKAKEDEMGWHNGWTEGMDCAVGRDCAVKSINNGGIRLDDGKHNLSYPFFILEVREKAVKLPEPIKLSSECTAKFNPNQSIDVGCQNIEFEVLEAVYLAAKGIKS